MLSHAFEHNALNMMTQDHMYSEESGNNDPDSRELADYAESWSLASIFGLETCCAPLFSTPSVPVPVPIQTEAPKEINEIQPIAVNELSS